MRERGLHPAEAVLLAYGGAGPMHACSVAQAAGIRHVVTVPFAAVFSAFGASSADVEHTYLEAPGSGVEERLQAAALRDMRGEGFAPREVTVELERVRVRAVAPLEHHEFTRVAAFNGAPKSVDRRDVHWPGAGVTPTQIYSLAGVPPRHRIDGPAIVESDDTTCVIPDGWSFEIDEYGNPWMHHERDDE
jgi:N-methylhydantoinase A/oxoprolinase/acetone carboxylase beta subunit